MISARVYFTLITLMAWIGVQGSSGNSMSYNNDYDTVHLTVDSMLVFRDSIFVPNGDTTFVIDSEVSYKIKRNTYKRTELFYDSVYYKSQKSAIAKTVYNILLSHNPKSDQQLNGEHVKSIDQYQLFEGKTIKSIGIFKVDLLEGSVDDTSLIASSGFAKVLNKSHVKTHNWILRNYLMVKEGDRLNPSLLSDNERIIRDLPSIEDVRFYVVQTEIPNEVHLVLVTKDLFPIGATANFSSFNNVNVEVWNNNLFGMAYDLGGKLLYNSRYADAMGYELYTKYRNLWGSFIDGSMRWLDAYDSQWFKVDFSKEFNSPYTKYGGGFQLHWGTDFANFRIGDTTYREEYQTNYQDFWIGKSFLIGDKSSRNNIVISGRVAQEVFVQTPEHANMEKATFHDKFVYFGKVSYANYSFYKAKMVRAYGITENIPYGLNTGLTFAHATSNIVKGFYVGINVGAGKYMDKFGYLAGNIITGGFYGDNKISYGLFESNLFYYTPLVSMGRYKSRSFLKLKLQSALSKDLNTNIGLEDDLERLEGRNERALSTLSINYEFVLFAPWYSYGFRFAPYLFADAAILSSSRNDFINANAYTAFGVGLRIRNESLAFKTIILSFGFIPNTITNKAEWFYSFRMGETDLVPMLDVEKPYILRNDVLFPD